MSNEEFALSKHNVLQRGVTPPPEEKVAYYVYQQSKIKVDDPESNASTEILKGYAGEPVAWAPELPSDWHSLEHMAQQPYAQPNGIPSAGNMHSSSYPSLSRMAMAAAPGGVRTSIDPDYAALEAEIMDGSALDYDDFQQGKKPAEISSNVQEQSTGERTPKLQTAALNGSPVSIRSSRQQPVAPVRNSGVSFQGAMFSTPGRARGQLDNESMPATPKTTGIHIQIQPPTDPALSRPPTIAPPARTASPPPSNPRFSNVWGAGTPKPATPSSPLRRVNSPAVDNNVSSPRVQEVESTATPTPEPPATQPPAPEPSSSQTKKTKGKDKMAKKKNPAKTKKGRNAARDEDEQPEVTEEMKMPEPEIPSQATPAPATMQVEEFRAATPRATTPRAVTPRVATPHLPSRSQTPRPGDGNQTIEVSESQPLLNFDPPPVPEKDDGYAPRSRAGSVRATPAPQPQLIIDSRAPSRASQRSHQVQQPLPSSPLRNSFDFATSSPMRGLAQPLRESTPPLPSPAGPGRPPGTPALHARTPMGTTREFPPSPAPPVMELHNGWGGSQAGDPAPSDRTAQKPPTRMGSVTPTARPGSRIQSPVVRAQSPLAQNPYQSFAESFQQAAPSPQPSNRPLSPKVPTARAPSVRASSVRMPSPEPAPPEIRAPSPKPQKRLSRREKEAEARRLAQEEREAREREEREERERAELEEQERLEREEMERLEAERREKERLAKEVERQELENLRLERERERLEIERHLQIQREADLADQLRIKREQEEELQRQIEIQRQRERIAHEEKLEKLRQKEAELQLQRELEERERHEREERELAKQREKERLKSPVPPPRSVHSRNRPRVSDGSRVARELEALEALPERGDRTPKQDRARSPQERVSHKEALDMLRTPRTSYTVSPSILADEVGRSQFHDEDLCVLLHSADDPSMPDVVRKAVRKAVRSRVKKLGLKNEDEYRLVHMGKGKHKHRVSAASDSIQTPTWAIPLFELLQDAQARLDSLDSKLDSASLNSRRRRIESYPEEDHEIDDDYIPGDDVNQSPRSRYTTVDEGQEIDARHLDQSAPVTGTTSGFRATSPSGRHRGAYDPAEEEYEDEEEEPHTPPSEHNGIEEQTFRLKVKDPEEYEQSIRASMPIPDIPEDSRFIDDSRVAGRRAVQPTSQEITPSSAGPAFVRRGDDQLWKNPNSWDTQGLPSWQLVHQRLLNWTIVWSMSELERGLESTATGHQVDEAALTIWTTQCYKRYVRVRTSDHPPQKVDRLFVPPNVADAINSAVYNGRHADACSLLKDLWAPFGFDEMPRLILVLARHRRDNNHWVVHRFSIPEGTLCTYDTYPEKALADGRPLGWWFAIRSAWPHAMYPNADHLVQKLIRIHRPLQLLIDNSIAAAAIWRNLLMGSKAERGVDLVRMRDLIHTEVRAIKMRKEQGKLALPAPRSGWDHRITDH